MCQGSETTVSIGATSVSLVGANPSRVGLLITSPTTATITISANAPAVGGIGITIQPKTLPVKLTIDDVGDWIQKSLNAVASVGTESIGIIEVLE